LKRSGNAAWRRGNWKHRRPGSVTGVANAALISTPSRRPSQTEARSRLMATARHEWPHPVMATTGWCSSGPWAHGRFGSGDKLATLLAWTSRPPSLPGRNEAGRLGKLGGRLDEWMRAHWRLAHYRIAGENTPFPILPPFPRLFRISDFALRTLLFLAPVRNKVCWGWRQSSRQSL